MASFLAMTVVGSSFFPQNKLFSTKRLKTKQYFNFTGFCWQLDLGDGGNNLINHSPYQLNH
jgi:hypothetical protein